MAPSPFPPTTEPGLIDAARDGDAAARKALVLAHQEPLFRMLVRLSSDHELARDLSQEAFVKALNALGGFRAGAAFRPWLFKIANNLFLDHVRARRPESLDALLEDGMEAGGEDAAIVRTPLQLDLEAALTLLPVSWRQAIVLRHQEDLPYEEIAEILGVPLGTVKTWIFRGRERLRELLGG
ncbi:MAG: polymerase sigma factor, sigma-70 family [Cyanobacteria bacterium RYN_339]|nr:polymerase sigma factor, sigma-70 family [Cyanobacteria bacterium RYN_339]